MRLTGGPVAHTRVHRDCGQFAARGWPPLARVVGPSAHRLGLTDLRRGGAGNIHETPTQAIGIAAGCHRACPSHPEGPEGHALRALHQKIGGVKRPRVNAASTSSTISRRLQASRSRARSHRASVYKYLFLCNLQIAQNLSVAKKPVIPMPLKCAFCHLCTKLSTEIVDKKSPEPGIQDLAHPKRFAGVAEPSLAEPRRCV